MTGADPEGLSEPPIPPRGSGAPRATRAGRVAGLVVAPAAAVLLVLGGVLLLAGGAGPADFGWFAYAPLSETTLGGGLVLVSRSMQFGALMVLAGLVLLAFWGGYLVGRRQRPSRSS